LKKWKKEKKGKGRGEEGGGGRRRRQEEKEKQEEEEEEEKELRLDFGSSFLPPAPPPAASWKYGDYQESSSCDCGRCSRDPSHCRAILQEMV